MSPPFPPQHKRSNERRGAQHVKNQPQDTEKAYTVYNEAALPWDPNRSASFLDDLLNKLLGLRGNFHMTVITLIALFLAYYNESSKYIAFPFPFPIPGFWALIWLSPTLFLNYLLTDDQNYHIRPPFNILGIPHDYILPKTRARYNREQGQFEMFYLSHDYMLPLYVGLYYGLFAIYLLYYIPNTPSTACVALSFVLLLLLNNKILLRKYNIVQGRPDDIGRIAVCLSLPFVHHYARTNTGFSEVADFALAVAVSVAPCAIVWRLIQVWNRIQCRGVPLVRIVHDLSGWDELDEAWGQEQLVPEKRGIEFNPSYQGTRHPSQKPRSRSRRASELEQPDIPIPLHLLPYRTFRESLADTTPHLITRYTPFFRKLLYVVSLTVFSSAAFFFLHHGWSAPTYYDTIPWLFDSIFGEDDVIRASARWWTGWIVGLSMWGAVGLWRAVSTCMEWVTEKAGFGVPGTV